MWQAERRKRAGWLAASIVTGLLDEYCLAAFPYVNGCLTREFMAKELLASNWYIRSCSGHLSGP
jgi:hypothetical protein